MIDKKRAKKQITRKKRFHSSLQRNERDDEVLLGTIPHISTWTFLQNGLFPQETHTTLI